MYHRYADNVANEMGYQTHARKAGSLPRWVPLHRNAYQGMLCHIGYTLTILTRCRNCQSSADKLIREMQMFGQDFENFHDDAAATDANGDMRDFPTDMQSVSSREASAPTTSVTTSNAEKSKKSKVNAKSTGLQYQFQIVRI